MYHGLSLLPGILILIIISSCQPLFESVNNDHAHNGWKTSFPASVILASFFFFFFFSRIPYYGSINKYFEYSFKSFIDSWFMLLSPDNTYLSSSGYCHSHLSNVPYDSGIADFITVLWTKEPLILRVTYCAANKALPRVFGFYREPPKQINPYVVASRARAGHANLSILRLTVVC